MPARQSRIDGFLSPSGSRARKRAPRASAEAVGVSAPGIQLNFVDPRSYTISTSRRTKDSGDKAMGGGRKQERERRSKYGEEEQGVLNARPAASSSSQAPSKRKREWNVISEDSDDAKSVGSEEGTPERLDAVRLEAGKSQLQWGERGRWSKSGSSGSSDGSASENEEEERQKRRVIVSGEESDDNTPSTPPPPPGEPEVIDLDSEPEVSTHKTPPIRSSSPPDPLADMFSDIPDPTQPSSSGYTRAARRLAPVAAASTSTKRRRRHRGPTPEEESSVYESEDPERIIASPPPYRRAPPTISRDRVSKASTSQGKNRKRGKRGVVDPDEEDEPSEEEEDPEALVKELEMDSPVVVESRLRERNKKTEHQKRLEELKRRKEAKARGERYTSPVDVPSDGSDELIILDKPTTKAGSKGKGKATRADPDEEEDSEGAWTVEDEEEMDGFIDDADKDDDDHDEISNLLPEQYQMARYQNLEYHFKVISQFLIHLIIRGPSYARERKKQYYRASYEAISRKLQSQKDSLVTSSVWKPDFKTSLETYPELIISYLDEVEYGCDACHLTGRLSKFSGELRGKAYDPETFEDLEDESPDSSSEEEEHEKVPPPSRGPFKLGKFCRLRAEVFHEFSHWERSLHESYKDAYGRLQRRIRSGDRSLGGLTAKSLKDPDEVVQWLDSQGHIMSQFERLSGFEFDLQKLS
ncbi:hypothetical protein NliqN6_6443 [Naganishia liquefaciens]|uniref:DUF4211 domain-containing protein n=1 Tax=Naganishia liquefaciens TaxID=104408 RepID=A0A8H3YJZ9_9TREE|nr:hypothetical protein NliqN6_6443 [Naganishia liquefaciens]